MKKILLLILLSASYTTFSQVFNTAFSYQGELLDNGSPANGDYDILFDLYDDEFSSDPVSLLDSVVKTEVEVSNGLFIIPDLDFGSSTLGNEAWIEISVKPSSDPGAFERLLSRQRINTVPYAHEAEFSNTASLANFAVTAGEAATVSSAGASDKDILTFNGTQWRPTAPYWEVQNNTLFTSDNNSSSQIVLGLTQAVGTAKLTVNQAQDGINTQFRSGNDMFNEFVENNVPKGYIGSVQDGSNSGTTTDDFEIGTAVANPGSLHLTTEATPQLTITRNGNVGVSNTSPTRRFQVNGNALVVTSNDLVGIGNISPSAKLDIRTTTSVSDGGLRVSINGTSRLHVRNDEIYINDDVKHGASTNGLMKYMVKARCLGSGSSILSSYNGMDDSAITISDTGTSGNCWINFPRNINNRYWQVSAVSANGRHVANCNVVAGNDRLLCQRTLSGIINDGDIMILVY